MPPLPAQRLAPDRAPRRWRHAIAACCALALSCLAAACADDPGAGPTAPDGAPDGAAVVAPAQRAPAVPTAGALPPSDGELVTEDVADVATLDCVADARAGAVRCAAADDGGGARLDPAPGATTEDFAGQGSLVRLAASNNSYVGTTFEMDVTVQNVMNEAIGTPDGTVQDAAGIRVYFSAVPTATAGSGTITVVNPDGTLGTGEPYYEYDEILTKDAVSSAKRWRFDVPATVTAFTFRVRIATSVQPLLVINEVMANPKGSVESNGEWFELYNAGTRPVDIRNFVIADSAASGRRPYHLISSSVVIASGGYAVLGQSTVNNGGVTLDYAYGSALSLANSLDAVKIARIYGTDTLTIDRTQYSTPSVSAQDGISRELKNPALDNANMDGSNWADAAVTATFSGPIPPAGGPSPATSRGTPGAQNSTFVPILEPTGLRPPERPRGGGPAWLGPRR